MRGVAADEDAPVMELVGNETAADPILFGKHLIGEVWPNTEDGTNGPVAINRIETGLVAIKVVMNKPPLTTIDCHDGTAASRIECDIHPRAFSRQPLEKTPCADVRRLHPLDGRRT